MASWTIRTLTEALSTYPQDMIVEIDQGCGCCSGGYEGIEKGRSWKDHQLDVMVIGFEDKD